MSHFAEKVMKNLGIKPPKPSHPPGSPAIATGPAPPNTNSLIVNQDERSLSVESRFNGTYTRLARLNDGTILAAFAWYGPDRLHGLKVSKSTDNGQTFMDISEIFRGKAEIDNPFLLEIAPNHVLAAFRNHDFAHPQGFTVFRMTVYESKDGGYTWTHLSHAVVKQPPLGIWEPFMRIAGGGVLQMTYSHEFAPDDQRSMMVISHDHGRTWSEPRCIEGVAENRFRDGMTGIVPTFDMQENLRVLVMVFETTRFRPNYNLECVISYDDGYTWHHRQPIYNPPKGRNAGAPQIVVFGDGSMAVVFMTNDYAEKSKTGRQNAFIKVVYGGPPRGGKIDWSSPAMVSEPPGFWPGIMALDSQRALAAYEHGGPRVRSITWSPK
ncbi:uncharacterized protein TRUGW13939_02179 [Talaromyces rugulosus]|uniref:Sialidase domain-containing protein n=1 Tax=Talaromyces rugulosus TaxID=121627 RepID=A0A7H8QMC9_TALRU|nr:uncharacterized protein TRUGW13939_02179 [Talaromyces rugulosus]QKX55087.1 hypothetical protein TRUGW13939_02179 [Talaromyces rugulosus]